MSVTSWKTASTVADDSGVGTVSWVSDDFGTALVGNEVSSDNGVYAGAINTGSSITHYLKSTNYGFTSSDVPSGATILGFEIEVRQYRIGAPTIASTLVKFVKTGSVVGNDIGTATDWATSETATTYGTSTELGGQSWTQSDVTASNFGCVISVTSASSRVAPSGRNLLVDQVRMRIYYDASNASVSISTSTATANTPTPAENHGSSISIGLLTASGVMPNINLQVGSQTSLSVSTASANTLALTASAGDSVAIATSTASATMLTLAQNHGSAIAIAASTATANINALTPSIFTFLSTYTATANAPAPAQNHGSSITLGVYTASANSIAASALGTSGGTRRIIISNG
jgi:hypothetical protein